MKKIVGYVRAIPGGEGIANVPVSIRLKKDGTLITAGGMSQATTNPINTDVDGRFEWQCELSPGPLKVEAAIDSTAELKVRVGEEVMQAGDIFITDISTMGRTFTNGVIANVDNELLVSPVTGALQIKIASGALNINGRIFQTHTDRNISITGNSTLAKRHDVVYAEHHIGGADVGKQTIGVVEGTINDVVPAIPTVANVIRIALATVHIPQGATSVTVTPTVATAVPTSVNLEQGVVKLEHLHTEVRDQLLDKWFSITDPQTGQTLIYNGTKFINKDNLLSSLKDAAIASPAANQVLTYNGTKWINKALPAPPVMSIASATDTTITSPTNGQILGYSGGKWKNLNLSIDIPAPKYAETVFSAYGRLTNNEIIASTSVSVPAGTWLIRGEATGQSYGLDAGGGTFNVWFQGDAAPSNLALRQINVKSDQGVDRQWYLACRKLVTVSNSTMFTLDLWAAHHSGAQSSLREGVLNIMAL